MWSTKQTQQHNTTEGKGQKEEGGEEVRNQRGERKGSSDENDVP